MTKLTQEQLDSLSPEVRAIVEAQQTALATVKTKGDIFVTESGKRFSVKVSEKGGLSFYGFGRFPITMYVTALLSILDCAAGLRTYIKDHTSELSWEQTAEQKAARKAAAEVERKANVA